MPEREQITNAAYEAYHRGKIDGKQEVFLTVISKLQADLEKVKEHQAKVGVFPAFGKAALRGMLIGKRNALVDAIALLQDKLQEAQA